MSNKNLGPQILELRKQGYSYNKIKSILKCSKGTIAYHLGKDQKQKTTNRTKKLRKSNPFIQKMESFSGIYILPKINKKSNIFNFKRTLKNKRDHFNYMKKRKQYSKPSFTLSELQSKLESNPSCYLTGEPIDLYQPKTYQFDHIIPVSRGGTNDLDNLGLTTKRANQSKTDMTPEEYIELCKQTLIHNGYNVTKKVALSGCAPETFP